MKKQEAQQYFNYLKNKGFLHYGTIIPREVFEDLFNDSQDILWKQLKLRQYLDKQGYFCRSGRGLPEGAIEIIGTKERQKHGVRKVKNKYNGIETVREGFLNTDASQVSAKDYEEIMHNLDVINAMTYSIRSKLNDL